jgi:hypothetical protein
MIRLTKCANHVAWAQPFSHSKTIRFWKDACELFSDTKITDIGPESPALTWPLSKTTRQRSGTPPLALH